MNPKDPEFYIKGVLAGDRRLLAKTITLIESAKPAHKMLAREVLNGLLPRTGNSVRIGITGVPGVGKSMFIESLGGYLIGEGHKLAVLAIDPSSSRSGGSILGDKTRMEKLAADPGAFIRPSPSGGTLGGVASKTRETMLVCEAAGFDVILIETVGVGQSETAVSSMVDFFMVLMLAGAGDELQGIKKGILEIADTIIINKADGDNLEKAEKAKGQYEAALHFLTPQRRWWTPPVMTCSALKGSSIADVWNSALNFIQSMKDANEFHPGRRKQSVDWMWSMIDEGLKDLFLSNPVVKKNLSGVMNDVEKGKLEPSAGAFNLLSNLKT
jgi:LAO/AO transport system kinase